MPFESKFSVCGQISSGWLLPYILLRQRLSSARFVEEREGGERGRGGGGGGGGCRKITQPNVNVDACLL